MTTLFAEVFAVAFAIGMPPVFSAGLETISLRVYATSCALNGVPFDHLTPLRIVSVRVFPPWLHVYPVASHGMILWVA